MQFEGAKGSAMQSEMSFNSARGFLFKLDIFLSTYKMRTLFLQFNIFFVTPDSFSLFQWTVTLNTLKFLQGVLKRRRICKGYISASDKGIYKMYVATHTIMGIIWW